MDSLSKKISNLGIHDIRNAARFAQNMIIQYDPYQVDIRRATNTDSWGPTPKQLNKVLRNRAHVPMYLITEYTMKRLVDHMAKRPKNLYEKARKQYVNYGSEWRVVLKCLVVLEFLLLTCNSGQELEQILSCMNTHKHILTRDTLQFKVEFSSDGKMETHERGIRKKCEQLIQYLEDSAYLKRARAKHRQQAAQVHSSGSGSSIGTSYNANDIRVGDTSSVYDLDDGLEEYTPQNSQASEISSGPRPKHSAIVDEQRRQRREILRERIKNSEKQRKATAQAKQEPVIDLLDLDDDGITGHGTKNDDYFSKKNSNKNDKDNDVDDDDDDSDFGDFQSDVSSQLGAVGSSSSQNMVAKGTVVKPNDTHGLGSQWDYLSPPLTNSTSNSTAADASSTKQPSKDAFADLFTYSKSHI